MGKESFALRLAEALDKTNLKPIELANKTKIDKSSISNYLSGNYLAKQDKVYLMAKALNVSEAWLMGYDVPMERQNINIDQIKFENATIVDIENDMIQIPVLGSIPAGVPIEAIENILGYEFIPKEWTKDNMEYFGLQISGNSMNPEYKEKDTIIVLKQDYCESGQDCVIVVDGDASAVFKRIIKQGDNIILKPLNNEYEPVMYTKEDIEKLPIRILGVVKEVRRKLS